MVVGVGGIGNFRDLGDPNDPRRGQSAPQPNATPGLPEPAGSWEELADQMAQERAAAQQSTKRPDPIDLLIAAQRQEMQGEMAPGPVPRPTQRPPASPTNTEYVDRSFGVSRGYGAGGGAQVEPPMQANRGRHDILDKEDGTREIVTPSKARRVYHSADRVSRFRNPPSLDPWDQKKIAQPEKKETDIDTALNDLKREFAAIGIPLEGDDLAMLDEYAGNRRPSERVEGTRVVQTQNREKPEGFSPLSDGNIDEMYRGSRPVPNSTGKEKSPYYTVDVPTMGRDRKPDGIRRIDPRDAYLTEMADSETVANALHMGEEEVTTSYGRYASDLREKHRTPMMDTATFNAGLKAGTIVQVTGDRAHIADRIESDGSRTPIFESGVRDNTPEAAPMYRIGQPMNINPDAARNDANPRYRDESSAFNTQVVRTNALVKEDENGVKRSRIVGDQTETGPVPFLNRDDAFAGVHSVRRNAEKAFDVRGERGKGPHLEHLSPAVQDGIRRALEERPAGGTRKDRIAHDTASSFVQEGKNGAYLDTKSLAAPVDGLETAIADLDQVLKELSNGRYMADPDVANGYQRMAIEIEAGRMPATAVPERAKDEVERFRMMLRANRAPVDRVPIQTAPIITEVVPDNPADLVAEEINGPARNFDGEGRVVQGSYGDFALSQAGDGPSGGFGVTTAPDPTYSPEFQKARSTVDEMFGFTSPMDGTIGGEAQVKLNQLSGQVLADAVANTPAPMVSAESPQFQAQLRASAAKLGAAPVNVVQGRSSLMRTPNDQAVVETGTAVPQTQQAGIANTESVSQLNAPAPQGQVDVDPEIARLQPFVGNGVRQSQIDLIAKGRAAGATDQQRTTADQLVSLFRKRFR